MANVFYGADNDEFSAFVHGVIDNESIASLKNSVYQSTSRLTESGRRFVERAQERFDSIDYDLIRRKVRSVKRKVKTYWDEDRVREITSVASMQHPGETMERWIMTIPSIRKRARAGRTAAYRKNGVSKYLDYESDLPDESRSDYMILMNGIAQTSDEGDTTYTTYYDAFVNGYEELDLSEKMDILFTGENVFNLMNVVNGDDPLDPKNGSL